jgi:hypothetical protein
MKIMDQSPPHNGHSGLGQSATGAFTNKIKEALNRCLKLVFLDIDQLKNHGIR